MMLPCPVLCVACSIATPLPQPLKADKDIFQQQLQVRIPAVADLLLRVTDISVEGKQPLCMLTGLINPGKESGRFPLGVNDKEARLATPQVPAQARGPQHKQRHILITSLC